MDLLFLQVSTQPGCCQLQWWELWSLCLESCQWEPTHQRESHTLLFIENEIRFASKASGEFWQLEKRRNCGIKTKDNVY